MKKLIGLIVIFCFAFSGWTQTKDRGRDNEFKVMAWNIWHGGKGESLPVKDARPEIIDIIKHSGADVVLMIETYGAAPMIAEGLGFHYSLLSSNLCIFSRFPIAKTLTFADSISTFNFGGAEIMVHGKTPIVFFDTWLHYLPDTRLAPLDKSSDEIIAWETAGTRDEEIRKILSTINPFLVNSNAVPIVMGGDFNSHSHLDWTEETKNLFNHGGAVVDWPVSRAMTDAGMIDSFREVNQWPVTNLGVSWLSGHDANGTTHFSRQDRIDYIYYQGRKIKATDSETFNAPTGKRFNFHGKNFMFPSDHGFVLTTFKIEE